MADNVNLPLTGAGGTTATVASEDIGGVQYQRVKLMAGAVGSTVAGSSAVIGTVNVSSGVILAAGSSANVIGQVAISTANQISLGLGSSATYNFVQSIPFSSGNVARSSISTTVDTQLIAANANRKALVIANRSTAQTVGCGFSTAVLTTAGANVDFYIGPSSFVSFGLQGGMPLYLGPLRGINLTSTTVAGSVGVTEFS